MLYFKHSFCGIGERFITAIKYKDYYAFFTGAAAGERTAVPLKWLMEMPIWIDQWPLTLEQLQPAEALINEITIRTYGRDYFHLEHSHFCYKEEIW